jgi:hypothetical protein
MQNSFKQKFIPAGYAPFFYIAPLSASYPYYGTIDEVCQRALARSHPFPAMFHEIPSYPVSAGAIFLF